MQTNSQNSLPDRPPMEIMVTASLPTGCRAAERLIERYGSEQVWQVEQLSDHIFRAWLNNGGVALCIVQEDGSMEIRELEDVC